MNEVFKKGSAVLHDIYEQAKALQEFHMYRWKYFVETSERGVDCRYAKASIKAYIMDEEHDLLMNTIHEIRRDLDQLEAYVLKTKTGWRI